MKSLTAILSLFCIFFFTTSAFAQFDIGDKIKRKADQEIDKTINNGINETEDAIKKGGEEDKDVKNTNDGNVEGKNSNGKLNEDTNPNQFQQDDDSKKELKIWSKYDFVPGDKIIFEDDLSGEESGEFPSRWDLLSGSAEVASLGGENVIHFVNNNSIIRNTY